MIDSSHKGLIDIIIRGYGKYTKKIELGQNGDFNIFFIDGTKRKKELFFNNNGLVKYKKISYSESGQDQYLYFDTSSNSIAINYRKSHGIVIKAPLDSVRKNINYKLSIINIGNHDKMVYYDLFLDKDSEKSFEIISKRQLNEIELEVTFKVKSIGDLLFKGELIQYYKNQSKKGADKIFLKNSFGVVISSYN